MAGIEKDDDHIEGLPNAQMTIAESRAEQRVCLAGWPAPSRRNGAKMKMKIKDGRKKKKKKPTKKWSGGCGLCDGRTRLVSCLCSTTLHWV
jgi:hypothetical protein